jgi:hypothetical protein
MSNGGFNNWNWGQFGKSVGFGALSGAVTFGIGEGFQALGNFAGKFGTPLIQGATHGIASGGISALQGGDFLTGFASGTLGSWAASGYGASGLGAKLGDVGMYGFSALSGGIGAAVTGGDFLQGTATGLITAGLNHLQHRGQVKMYKDVEKGLRELWESSVEQRNEMTGYYTNRGLITAWDSESTSTSSKLRYIVKDGKIYMKYGFRKYEVNGVVHTHPSLVPNGIGISDYDINAYQTFTINFKINNFQIIYNGNLYQMVGPSKDSYRYLHSISR